jgi:hypothetical protein
MKALPAAVGRSPDGQGIELRIDAVALQRRAHAAQPRDGRLAQALGHQHRQDFDDGQVRQVGVDAHAHHRVLGHVHGQQQIGARPARCRRA